ncbi:hypothetical protein ACH47Z_25650 [Streptomyces sp. NPDC020192]|uniref:hypothetical protein n=1 Tax=Streptomyces sp. NPDC020192 TaxID=3365066 RepID=UPI003797B769
MVSSTHEALHRIFQQDPGLFARAARAIGAPFADPVASTPLPTDLTENHPVERRVDTLLKIETADSGEYILAVEAQGKKDLAKRASWSYYLAHLYAKYKIPPVLVVVCPDRSTARWAAQHVEIGPPEWPCLTLRPLVLGPNNIPVVTTPEEVAHDLPMTVLSAALHRQDPEIKAILEALAPALLELQERDKDTAEIFIELTQQGLDRSPAASLWRSLVAVDLSFFKSSLAEELRDEGRAKAKAEDVLRLLDRRGVEIQDEARERVTSCDDLDLLNVWFDRAITATSASEVFTETE